MPSTLLLPLPLPADGIRIGSFVLNPMDPTQDYFDPQEKEPDFKPSILRVDMTDFTNTIRDARSKEVKAVLTNYFSTTMDWGKSKMFELSSAKAATYLMKNSGSWFEQVCALSGMRCWFECFMDRKIYLLVGLRTVFDGRFKINHSISNSTGGQVQVPADVLAGLPPMGLDVGGGGKVAKDQTASSEFSAAGERIWALQYRQIKFKWYSSKTVENAALETGTRWVSFNQFLRSPIMWSGCRDDQTGHEGANTARKTAYAELPKFELPPVRFMTCARADDQSEVQRPPVKDTEDMVEAFMDEELDLEDQFEVQNTNGETLFIPREGEGWEQLWPPSYKMAQRARNRVMPSPMPYTLPILLPPLLETAADDPEEDVELSSEASINERAEQLE